MSEGSWAGCGAIPLQHLGKKRGPALAEGGGGFGMAAKPFLGTSQAFASRGCSWMCLCKAVGDQGGLVDLMMEQRSLDSYAPPTPPPGGGGMGAAAAPSLS